MGAPALDGFLARLPDSPGRERFLGELEGLVELFADLFGAERVGLRLGTLDAPKNPGEAGPEAAARSAPFGLLVGWDPQLVAQLAVECAAQTHGHPVACLAAGATPPSLDAIDTLLATMETGTPLTSSSRT